MGLLCNAEIFALNSRNIMCSESRLGHRYLVRPHKGTLAPTLPLSM
ncbi:hypothetical protein Z949_3316 [Sulfitobacter guttiformis KCTC 32187]|nr:hypothetical protein Z949_3316 [Sulfitobacter guttiformis KCTC 32187]